MWLCKNKRASTKRIGISNMLPGLIAKKISHYGWEAQKVQEWGCEKVNRYKHCCWFWFEWFIYFLINLGIFFVLQHHFYALKSFFLHFCPDFSTSPIFPMNFVFIKWRRLRLWEDNTLLNPTCVTCPIPPWPTPHCKFLPAVHNQYLVLYILILP